jgi:hypothetical protein
VIAVTNSINCIYERKATTLTAMLHCLPEGSNPSRHSAFADERSWFSKHFGTFKLEKRRQYFVRGNDKPLSIAAMRVSNEDRSPFDIHGIDTAPTPTGFARIVSDDFLQCLRDSSTKRLSRFRLDMPSLWWLHGKE